jgi:DNA-binding winged helix-turn-helix (wHTH) protein
MNAVTLDRSALVDFESRPTRKLQVQPPLKGSSPDPLRIRFGPFELDEADARLTANGNPVPLPPKPFAVLCALTRSPQRLLTTNALLDAVWGHQFFTDSVLRTAISELRTALDDDARKPRFIETVSRRGYRFIADPIGASPQRVPAIERDAAAGRDHPALMALTALCRCDAALAELICAVACTLEHEPLVPNES